MNEIPLNLFSIFLIADLILILYAFLKINKAPTIDVIFASSISAFLSFISANMILNGEVVAIQSTGTEYSFIPIQSLPIHYLLLGFGVVMSIFTVFFTYQYLMNYFEKEKTFSAIGGWAGEQK